MATVQLSYTAAQIDAAIAKVNSLITIISGSIAQLYDGPSPIYPRTSSDAVFFNNDPTDTLTTQITKIKSALGEGYSYLGIATLITTPPSVVKGNIFYIATQAGLYTRFLDNEGNSIYIQNKGIYILKYNLLNGYWTLDVVSQDIESQITTENVLDPLFQKYQNELNLEQSSIGNSNNSKVEVKVNAILNFLNELVPNIVFHSGTPFIIPTELTSLLQLNYYSIPLVSNSSVCGQALCGQALLGTN